MTRASRVLAVLLAWLLLSPSSAAAQTSPPRGRLIVTVADTTGGILPDATVTLVRRLLRGERVWRAHREHYYQRLVLAGWGHRRTVAVEYVLMLACGLSAVAYGQAGAAVRAVILLGWIGIYMVLARGVRRVEEQAKAVGADGCETLRRPP